MLPDLPRTFDILTEPVGFPIGSLPAEMANTSFEPAQVNETRCMRWSPDFPLTNPTYMCNYSSYSSSSASSSYSSSASSSASSSYSSYSAASLSSSFLKVFVFFFSEGAGALPQREPSGLGGADLLGDRQARPGRA